MPDLSFDDLIPRRSGGAGLLNFDDLIPPQPGVPADAPADQSFGGKALGMANAAIRGATDTASFGFGPRIRAGIATATGLGGRFGEYERNLLQQQAIDAYERKNYPASKIAGEIGGAIALPVGIAGAPASLGGRMAAGAAAGAVQGGLFGAGHSEDLTNLQGVGMDVARGATLGGAIGGVAPAIVEGAMGVGRYIGNKTGILPAISGALNPEKAAARRVAGALERDAAVGGQRLAPDAMRAAQAGGQPTVVADLGGEATRGLARSAANTSPEARQALTNVVNERFEGQAPRIAEFVSGLGGGSNSFTTIERLQAEARAANRPNYLRAYAEGANGIWNDKLARLMESPAVKNAAKQAATTGANKAVAEGFRPTASPFAIGADGSIKLRLRPDGSTATPTLQFWDYVKRNLGDMVGELQRVGKKSAADDADTLRTQLVSALDEAAPSYAKARGVAEEFFGAKDAVEAGAKFVGSRGDNALYQSAISKLTLPEKKLFAHGFASELAAKVNEVGDRRSVLNSIFQSPAARERVTMALGPNRAARLEAYLSVETTMDMLRTAVSGNSTTARQLAELGVAGGVGGGIGYLGGGDAKSVTMGAILGGLARQGALKVDARVAQRVGEMLASGDPAAYQRALDVITRNQGFVQALRKITPKMVAAIIPQALKGSPEKKSRHEDALR